MVYNETHTLLKGNTMKKYMQAAIHFGALTYYVLFPSKFHKS
jgi:hypothetical protein